MDPTKKTKLYEMLDRHRARRQQFSEYRPPWYGTEAIARLIYNSGKLEGREYSLDRLRKALEGE